MQSGSRPSGIFGLTYRSPDPLLPIVGYFLPGAPWFVSPFKIRRPSQVIYWMLYFIVYIPGFFVPLFMQLDQSLTLLMLQLSMTCGMLLIALSYRHKTRNIPRRPLNVKLFWTIFCDMFCTCSVDPVIRFPWQPSFRIPERGLRREVREEDTSPRKTSALPMYPPRYSSVMNPFLIAYGLT